jgi:D-glycero-alpha-D-manno-heptose-7-phosphate kinase
MIISKTPFRISFAGGGTDLNEFYKINPGAVISTTIDKYMYLTINKRFDDTIRVSYSKTEIVDNVNKIKHPIAREALKLTGILKGVEIVSMADIPAGTGLGSSSSFTVGLLNILHAYKGQHKSAEELAREACKIEIDILKEPIGKQDQYAVAYGGLNHIQFNNDETVFVDKVICSRQTKDLLNSNLLLFYTGIARRSNSILSDQRKNTKKNLEYLKAMCGLSFEIKDALIHNDDLKFAGLLHKGWLFKKKLSGDISNVKIDYYYKKALETGALGGKLLGAGGGGFLLVYCEKKYQKELRAALGSLKETKFMLEPQGTKIIYVGGQ